ncbi:hypothetical protein M141_2434 [Bacteroides fragilis str. S38L5]|nr:hypothetical protein M141_2434 [Bacteroides fragilis str. S38L5]KXU43891.1 hypothetical protein HMPREF2530_02994 [Bacteroides fragilis]KXU43931.1 hypothetical protein HMPREF2533_02994 [Bacteroides fragilis]
MIWIVYRFCLYYSAVCFNDFACICHLLSVASLSANKWEKCFYAAIYLFFCHGVNKRLGGSWQKT